MNLLVNVTGRQIGIQLSATLLIYHAIQLSAIISLLRDPTCATSIEHRQKHKSNSQHAEQDGINPKTKNHFDNNCLRRS